MNTTQAQIGWGQVSHTRFRPRHHTFLYRSFFLVLPMRHLQHPSHLGGLAVNRPAALSFYDADHGDGRGPEQGGALAWLLEFMQARGLPDAGGPVMLQTFPRVWGYTFKPVSFWYVFHPQGNLQAIVAEVNNTFGERHFYWVPDPRWGHTHQAQKAFHVSPFCEVQGLYRFRWMWAPRPEGDRLVVRVDHDTAHQALVHTRWNARLAPLTPALQRRALWQFPLMTAMVVLRIHWQALRLWWGRVPFFHQPPAAPVPWTPVHRVMPTRPGESPADPDPTQDVLP